MDSNNNQNTLQVTIQPVLDPAATTNVTTELQERVSAVQANVEETKKYYTDNMGTLPIINTLIAPLDQFANELTKIGEALNKGLDTSKLGQVQQVITNIGGALSVLDSSRDSQKATASLIDPKAMQTLNQFTEELKRVLPSNSPSSIAYSDLGGRMAQAVAGSRAVTKNDITTVKRFLQTISPSVRKDLGFLSQHGNRATNVADYLPEMFAAVGMDTKSLRSGTFGVLKSDIVKNVKKQIAAIEAIPEADRTAASMSQLISLKKQLNYDRQKGHDPILSPEYAKQLTSLFEGNKTFAKVLIDAGIATKGESESTYRLPTQITRKMMGVIAEGLQKSFISSVAGYNSPDMRKIVADPFKINASSNENQTSTQEAFARMVVNRGGYENAQNIVNGMNLVQKIRDAGTNAFILPGGNNTWGKEVRVPNISRNLYRFDKYNVGGNGLSPDGTVLYQESEATRFLRKYGGKTGEHLIQKTTDHQGKVSPGIVVVDADSFDFEHNKEARDQFGNLAYGTKIGKQNYSFGTMHRGDEGQHITMIRSDLRQEAEEGWRNQQSIAYQNNANTNVLWQRGSALAANGKLSYGDIQKLNPYDRAAYLLYASTAFASPLSAYSQISVEDMPDNAKRAKTEDALNKIYSPSLEVTGSIGQAAKRGISGGLKFHFVRDEDKVSTLNGAGGGLIDNNGAVYLSSEILPHNGQIRGGWGALKGMGISITADDSGDIYSALKQSGLLDKNGQLLIGGQDVSHGLGIITESALKSPDIKETLLAIEEAADENGMVAGNNGALIPYREMRDEVLTQFLLNGEISTIMRAIDKKNESGKIGSQFMSHLTPTTPMIQHQRKMWQELDELTRNPDKALEAVFPSDKGDLTSRELHRLRQERDEDPDNPERAIAFAEAMNRGDVQSRIRSYISSRKRAMAEGHYFDAEGLDENSRITQGFLGTSFIQRILMAARASEENKDLSNVDVVKKTNVQLFKHAIKKADWKAFGLKGLSKEQKEKVAANALLLDNMFAGFSEDEMKELRDNGIIDKDLEDRGFIFDPMSRETRLGYHRDPSTKKDVMIRYNAAELLRGLEGLRFKNKYSFRNARGQLNRRAYASMFQNTIAVNPKDWEYLSSADEDGDAIKRFAGLYYNLLRSDVDANEKMEEAALQFYSEKFKDVQVEPIEDETPENAKANLIGRMSRSLVARSKMAQYSGQDSRVAQLGLTAEMLADPNNQTARKYYKAMMRSAELYDYATTFEKKPLEILMQNEDFMATALGPEFGKGAKTVTSGLTLGEEAYKEAKKIYEAELEKDPNTDKKVSDFLDADQYYVGRHGVTLDKSKMGRIDQFNLPSAFQANILTSILSRAGTQYDVDEYGTLMDYLVNDDKKGLGFQHAVGENEKNFLKKKRELFVEYYTGKRTGEISDSEMEEFRKLQVLAEEEKQKYIEDHRTGNPDTMKVDGQVVKISQWEKQHNRDIGYVQGKNIDLFGMTRANIEKALTSGMYYEDTAANELMNLYLGNGNTQASAPAPVVQTVPKQQKPATPKKPRKKKASTTASQPAVPPTASLSKQGNLPAALPQMQVVAPSNQPGMYTKQDGWDLLQQANALMAAGKTDEAEAVYEQAEAIIRSTTVSGHSMSNLAGQDRFATPMMAYGNLYGVTSPEDAGTSGALRKDAGDMMENYVLQHLKKQGVHVVDPLDVFGTDQQKTLPGELRVEADKNLRRKMGFNYLTPGKRYDGVSINGAHDGFPTNAENIRGMWDGLILDKNNELQSVLEMKTMGYDRFRDMMEGRNTDRLHFDENGVPYAYKIQAAAYAMALGKDDYTLAMTGLTDKDRRELEKAKKDSKYIPSVSTLQEGENFTTRNYKVSDLEIPDTDMNGNFVYEDYDNNGQPGRRVKMLRGKEALHALISKNNRMLSGENAPDTLMQTDNRVLGMRQAMIAQRLQEMGIVQPKDFVPIQDVHDIAANASSSTAALAINNGDVGALIAEILGKVSGMPMALEQRQAVGEIGKNLISEANNFNANMRKEIFKNNDASSSQTFMRSTQAQIENATNMLQALKSDENIKQILSEQPNTQGAEILSSMLKSLETSVGKMVDNRISAAVARGTREVEDAQKSFEETLKGKDGTENQRKGLESNQRRMKSINDMIAELEASANDDNLTKEQREFRENSAKSLQEKADALMPLYQQTNAALSKTSIDALDEAIGKQIQSPQEAAEKKIQELVKKAYGQGRFLVDAFKEAGITEEDFKQGMSRLFGTGWEGLTDEERGKIFSEESKIEDLLNGSTGGLMGTIQGQYRDELFGNIRRSRETRLRNANKSLRTNEARLAKKSLSPQELAKETRELEKERIRDSLEQYRNAFGQSKDPEEQAAYLGMVRQLLGNSADEGLAEKIINGTASPSDLIGLGGQYGMIEDYVQQTLAENKLKTARSVQQMQRKARRSGLAIDRKIASPEELAQEMREDKEWDIRDALQNARDKLSGVDETSLMNIAKEYLGEDITRRGLDRFLDGRMSEEDMAGLGGQWGSLGDYQRALTVQKARQSRLQEMSLNRRDRSLRRTLAGRGMSPEEQAQIAKEDMTQQMRENLEQRMTTFGESSPQFQQAVQRTLGENATKEDALAFLGGTATHEQMAAWGGDYAMLGNYGNYIQDRAMMQREGAEMSLDQLLSEKQLMKMQNSPFASTWGMRMMMQGAQQAQKERNLNFRIRQARQQLQMLDGESLTGEPKAQGKASPAAEAAAKPGVTLQEAMKGLPTQADDTYNGAVFYGKDAGALSENQQAQIALVDGFAKRMGVQVGIHDTLKAPDGSNINGRYDPTSNKIDLALDAEGNLITRTMGHEMTHYIRNNSKEDYNDLMSFAEKTLRGTDGYDFDGRVQAKMDAYNQGLPEEEWLTQDEAKEEVIADTMWDVLSGKDVMNDLQREHGAVGNAVSGHLGDYADAFHEMGTSINNPETQAMAAQSAQASEALRQKFFQASFNASQRRREAMGPNQRMKYSVPEGEAKGSKQQRARRKPKWMKDETNPYVSGDMVFAPRAAFNGKNFTQNSSNWWRKWDELTPEELKRVKNRTALILSKDFSRTGEFEETQDPRQIAEFKAIARRSRANILSKINARKANEDYASEMSDRIDSELKNAPDKAARKIVAKRAIQSLQAESESYKINKDGYESFVPGRDSEIINKEVERLKAEQDIERQRDEKWLADAKEEAQKHSNQRTVKRAQLAEGKTNYPEHLEQKIEEVNQRRVANQEKLKAATAQINENADQKKAQNAKELADLQNDTISWAELKGFERDSAISQATEKAMQERRDQLGNNQKEEASLRQEKENLRKKYGNKNFNKLTQKKQFNNEEEAADAARVRQIGERLQAIQQENALLSNELNPNSDEYKNVIENLPEVSEANEQFKKQREERDARIKYLENQADKDVEDEKKLALDQANAEYKKENDDIDRVSASLGKQYDAHTKLGEKQKAEELAAFDVDTKAKQDRLDAEVTKMENRLKENNAKREQQIEELKAEKIYDPLYDRKGAFVIDAAYRENLNEQSRNEMIENLRRVAKTGELPAADEETVADAATDAAGAAENATNAIQNLGEAAKNAAENLNENANDDSSGGDDGGSGSDDGGEEEHAPTPPSNPPPMPDVPEDTRAEDDPNYRTNRWHQRVRRRVHDDVTRYSDEEETRADRRETRATAGAALKDIGRSVIQTGSRAITNFSRSIFNSAINEAKNFVKQYDALMNEIQTITMKTGDEMSTIASQTVQQALELKASVTDVATIKADLYRQGLNDEEVNERMEQVIQFSKVTGIKASESVQIVTTAMNTGLADSAQQAMDVLTALGDAAATTADQIQKGIQKAGSSAKVAGVSYEELATLMTIGTSKTQLSGQQIGTALQTIFGRMNKVTQSNYISDLEGETTSLNDVEAALGIVGVKLRDNNGSFRSSYDVLRDLSGQWGNMNDTQKSLVTNAFAGTRQSNIFQTLMEGMSEDDGALLDEYLGLAENSEGTTQSKYEIAMQSLASSMEQVKTAWDSVVQAFVNNGTITGVLETITNFLTGIASLVEDAGGKTQATGTVVVAALLGVASSIAAVTLAAKVASGALKTMLSSVAGPLGWVVGLGTAILGLNLFSSMHQSTQSDETESLSETIATQAKTLKENTSAGVSSRADAIATVKEMMEEYNKLTTESSKKAYELNNAEAFNTAIGDLTTAIPGVSSAFDDVSLSAGNLAGALDEATRVANEQNEEERRKKYNEAFVSLSALAGEGIDKLYEDPDETIEGLYQKQVDDYNNKVGNTIGQGANQTYYRERALSALFDTTGAYGTEFYEWLTTGANASLYSSFLSTVNQGLETDIAFTDEDALKALIGKTYGNTLSGANAQSKTGSFERVFFAEMMEKFYNEKIKNGNQMADSFVDDLLDTFVSYVSEDDLPDGMTTAKIKQLMSAKLQANSKYYKNGQYTFDSSMTQDERNEMLNYLFGDFRNSPTAAFQDLTQYDTSDDYIYRFKLPDGVSVDENGKFTTTFNAKDESGNLVPRTIQGTQTGTGKHDEATGEEIQRYEISILDSEGNVVGSFSPTNDTSDLVESMIEAGLIQVDEDLKSQKARSSSETYTGLSSVTYNNRTNYDRSNGYLAMLQSGLSSMSNASFSTRDAFDQAMDEEKYGDTLLSQIVTTAMGADKSGASNAAWAFAGTDAGKIWLQNHPEYLTDTIMSASSTNGINTAGLKPLFDYLSGEGAGKDFADLETDENYQDLMQNLKTQLGDDMYVQLEAGELSIDDAIQYLNDQHEVNERSAYTDGQIDLMSNRDAANSQLANAETLGLTSDEIAKLTEEAEEAQKGLDLLGSAKQIRSLRKYGDESEDVASYLEEIAKGGRDAADAMNGLTSKMATLSTKQAALNKLKANKGKADKDAFSTLGISEDDFNLMKNAGTWDTYLNTMQDSLVQEWNETIGANLGEQLASKLSVADLKTALKIDPEVDVGEVTLTGEEAIAALGAKINGDLQAELQNAGASAKYNYVMTWNGENLEVKLVASEITPQKSSGGGGGGGKSAAEKLIDEQKKEKTLYEHMVKMVQYQQTKYQNADELGNYGLMIEKEIEVEKKRLPVIQKNIEKLKEQIATVAQGSDDWYSLRDAILEAEEEYEEVNNTIEENIKKLEENQQAIYKLRTDLEDTVKEEIENRKQEETDMLSGSVSMQETILGAIKQRYQDEWDLIKKDVEKKKQALEEEKSLIDERLQKRKDAADEQEKYEELAEYKKQLALISMDSTRTKDAAELREKIADLEEEIGWDIAEAEAERQTDAIQDQIDAYDDYTTEGDEKLEDYLNDANNFTDEVNKVLKMTQEEMFNWMKTNVQDYVLSLNDAQLQMVKSWEDTYKQMYGIVDTYWGQINGVLTSKETFLNYMKNSSDYINASDESKAQMIYNWEEAYDKWAAAQKKDADYAHSDDYGEGSYTLPYNTPHYDWNETLNEIANGTIQGYNATANAQLQALQGTTLQSGITLTQTETQQLKALLNAPSYVQTPNFSTVDTAAYGTNNNINIDEIQIVVNEASFADEDDYDAFALKVGDAFVKQLSKRGFTTANYSF